MCWHFSCAGSRVFVGDDEMTLIADRTIRTEWILPIRLFIRRSQIGRDKFAHPSNVMWIMCGCRECHCLCAVSYQNNAHHQTRKQWKIPYFNCNIMKSGTNDAIFVLFSNSVSMFISDLWLKRTKRNTIIWALLFACFCMCVCVCEPKEWIEKSKNRRTIC